MSNEKAFFERQVKEIENLSKIYVYLSRNNVCVADISMLLRSEYVLLVSAFDNYLHQIVRRKFVKDFFDGGVNLGKLQLSVDVAHELFNVCERYEGEIILRNALKKTLGDKSFQAPIAVEWALGLINIHSIWKKMGKYNNMSGKDNKNKMALIVQRRNQIAHEFDIDYNGELRDIELDTINDCKNFLSCLVDCIDGLID